MVKRIWTVCGEFDFDRAQQFRRQTQTAAKRSKEEFKFEGEILATSFALLMVEHLENEFALDSEDVHK